MLRKTNVHTTGLLFRAESKMPDHQNYALQLFPVFWKCYCTATATTAKSDSSKDNEAKGFSMNSLISAIPGLKHRQLQAFFRQRGRSAVMAKAVLWTTPRRTRLYLSYFHCILIWKKYDGVYFVNLFLGKILPLEYCLVEQGGLHQD